MKLDIGDSLKSAKKIQIYLQLDSNIGNFTWRCKYGLLSPGIAAIKASSSGEMVSGC